MFELGDRSLRKQEEMEKSGIQGEKNMIEPSVSPMSVINREPEQCKSA